MLRLIEDLRKEHAIITETLNKVRSLGVGSKEGQDTLQSAKRDLLAHLKKEDTLLYPFLNRVAESDADLKRTLDTFAKDMESISQTVLEFFEKYSGGGSSLDFARDFGRIYALLSQRISKEEKIIFKKYDELKV